MHIEQANAELEVIARRQEQELGSNAPEYVDRKITLVPLLDFTLGSVQTALLVLLGAVAMVLLIACANIANLLLSRAVSREREIAIRQALGANRSRIIRQMLTESGVLALLGGGLGLLLAVWSLDALVALVPAGSIPQGVEVSIDARVLVFTLAVLIATALVFGLWPALQASKVNLNESLKEGSQKTTVSYRNRRAQSLLIVIEVGLSLLLLDHGRTDVEKLCAFDARRSWVRPRKRREHADQSASGQVRSGGKDGCILPAAHRAG